MGDWNRPAEKSILDNTVDNTFTYRRSLNSDNNLDEISHIGIYSWISSSVPQNAPVSYGGVLLLFPYFRTEYTELSRTVQIVIASSGKMFSDIVPHRVGVLGSLEDREDLERLMRID